MTSDFPCTCILVLAKNRLYVLFVANGTQWYMDPWPFGFMAKWIHCSLDSWHNGFMAVWIHGTMDVWQFGRIVFSKTPPRHLRSSKIKTHYVRSPSFTVNEGERT